MQQLKPDRIERAFNALLQHGILQSGRKEGEAPKDVYGYIPICADFIFNTYNVGLEPTIHYFELEKKLTHTSVEGKRAYFCHALNTFINSSGSESSLSAYVSRAGNSSLTRHQLLEAINYLKLALIVSKTTR